MRQKRPRRTMAITRNMAIDVPNYIEDNSIEI